MKHTTTRRHRAQVMPIMVAAIGLLALVTILFINAFGFSAVTERAMESGARMAGLAGLQQVDRTSGLTRWDLIPEDTTDVTRRYAAYNLEGMAEGSPASDASYRSYFDLSSRPGMDLEDILLDPAGTHDGTVIGMDVEVIIPAQDDSQTSEHYLNCDTSLGPCVEAPADPLPDCDTTSDLLIYPQQVGSALSGECYDRSTVVIRLRLPARQLGAGSSTITKIIVTQAGTNE